MTYLDSSAQLMRIPRKVDENMTPWASFNKIVLRTSGLIYEYVSCDVLLQGTTELAMEQDFVMRENITTPENCLHDGVRIFPGVLALWACSAQV
mgnify:CR=1 FL=1